MVPGLLQTEGYATALFRTAGLLPEEAIGLRVQARLERQNLLAREHGVGLNFFVTEQVLRTALGGSRVLNEQLLPEDAEVEWRKSSHSGDCVEVALNVDGIAVRDSKDSAGPALRFSPTQWRAFTGRRAPRP